MSIWLKRYPPELVGLMRTKSPPMKLAVVVSLCLPACSSLERAGVKVAADAAEASSQRMGSALARLGEQTWSMWSRQELKLTLTGGQAVTFKALEAVRPKARWKIATTRSVKNFVRAFETGAKDPELYFKDPSIDPALLARWKAAPKEHRVFIVGSQEDTPLIQELRSELKAQGKEVFFYRFCAKAGAQLCDSTTVGAFFGTAGTAMAAVTAEAADSPFVPNEIAAALNLKNNETALLLITPQEVLDAAGRGVAVRMPAAITGTSVAPAQN